MAKSKKAKAHGSAETFSPVNVPPVVAATVEYECVGVSPWSSLISIHADAERAIRVLAATFYRWSTLWPQVCPDLTDAPELLAIGDLHVENFGTWLDLEGRLARCGRGADQRASIIARNDAAGSLEAA